MQKIFKRELYQAQIALIVAIILQFVVWKINHHLFQSQYLIILAEIILLVAISLLSYSQTAHGKKISRTSAFLLLGVLSVGNILSLVLILSLLVSGESGISGLGLLSSAIAIFLTNIIVFALLYWEVDSPGLTAKRWTKHDQNFLFVQQKSQTLYPGWVPEFFDYLYMSITNAINFAPADVKPLTRSAKLLMAVQALISVFTLALLVARAVNILD